MIDPSNNRAPDGARGSQEAWTASPAALFTEVSALKLELMMAKTQLATMERQLRHEQGLRQGVAGVPA